MLRLRGSPLGATTTADLVIDAAGASGALDLAFDIVRPGGQITKVAWGPDPLGISLDRLVAKSVTLRGSFSHTWPVWERVLSLLATDSDRVKQLIGWRGPLTSWREGFEAQAAGKVAKAVLQPGSTRLTR